MSIYTLTLRRVRRRRWRHSNPQLSHMNAMHRFMIATRRRRRRRQRRPSLVAVAARRCSHRPVGRPCRIDVQMVRMPFAVRVRSQIIRIVAAVEALRRLRGAAETAPLVLLPSLQPVEVLVQGGRRSRIAVPVDVGHGVRRFGRRSVCAGRWRIDGGVSEMATASVGSVRRRTAMA